MRGLWRVCAEGTGGAGGVRPGWWREKCFKLPLRARRGQIILLMADRVPISHIADTVGISRHFVYKWTQRFLQEGVAGLADKPGRGRRAEPGVADVTANGSMASDV